MTGESPENPAHPLPGANGSPAGHCAQGAAGAVPERSLSLRSLSLEGLLVPQALEAFMELHGTAYVRYAHLMLGSRAVADEVVDVVFEVVGEHWEHILHQEQTPGAYGWAVLQEVIDAVLAQGGRGPALTETAAFTAAIRAIQPAFATLESTIGLYSAISRLPQRQFAAVILRYALGYPTPRVALIMGVTEPTVRSILRFAKRRLAQWLHIDYRPDTTEED